MYTHTQQVWAYNKNIKQFVTSYIAKKMVTWNVHNEYTIAGLL